MNPTKGPQLTSWEYHHPHKSQAKAIPPDPAGHIRSPKPKSGHKPYCPYCDNRGHYLSLCPKFKALSAAEIATWIKHRSCWRCGRNHAPEVCTLKKPCKLCKQQHLTVLHDVCPQELKKVLMVNAASDTVYIDRPSCPNKVMLKLVKVCLHNAEYSLEGFAILDDGSERTLILPSAV
uniref:CCHC-type domain-containing protein n=1 Tax=Nothobranchius korthausae TaxID=1143690 RepID=A0A1A8EPU4_9TELE